MGRKSKRQKKKKLTREAHASYEPVPIPDGAFWSTEVLCQILNSTKRRLKFGQGAFSREDVTTTKFHIGLHNGDTLPHGSHRIQIGQLFLELRKNFLKNRHNSYNERVYIN